MDAAGNPYFIAGHRVYKLDRTGSVMLVAGTGVAGFSGDGGPAIVAQLSHPRSVAIDAAGNLFIADSMNGRIRKVDAGGIITTVAGNGSQTRSGDGYAALDAGLGQPGIVVVDSAGNLFFNDVNPLILDAKDLITGSPDYDFAVRKVSPDGTINTYAGIGGKACGDTGDNGQATGANLSRPWALAVDTGGNLYIGESWGNRVRKVTSKGIITTIAGIDTCAGGSSHGAYGGDGGLATSAALYAADGLAVDPAGNVYISDTGNNRVRKIAVATGIINTIVGTGTAGYSGDNGLAVSAQINQPSQLSLDAAGNLYILEGGRIRKVAGQGITTIVSGGTGSWGDGGLAANTYAGYPKAMTVDNAGNLYVADSSNHFVRELKTDGTIVRIAGVGTSGYSGDGAKATAAKLNGPSGVAVDSKGSVFIADTANSVIRRVDTTGVITTFAGTGKAGYSGDGGNAVSAQLNHPAGVAVNPADVVYISDSGNNVIRAVGADGKISNVAGTGTSGYSGDGGPAALAKLSDPTGMTFDSAGVLYFIDSNNGKARKIGADGNIQLAATKGLTLQSPQAIAVDASGYVYISDLAVCAVLPCPTYLYQVSPTLGYGILDYKSVSSLGWSPSGLAADRFGNLFLGGSPWILALYNGYVTPDQFYSEQNFIWLMSAVGKTPLLTATVTHSGEFLAGQQGAQYQITVVNGKRAAPSTGTATVTEILPAGMTLVSMSGSGWTCNSNVCTRADALGTGSAYPPITVSVNIGGPAAPQSVNQVTVSAPGSFITTANEYTNIVPLPTVLDVLNAATLQTGGIAPNEYITLKGVSLGPAKGVIGGPAATLGGTTVYAGGAQAMLTYAQDNQVNAILPWSISGDTTTIQVEYNGRLGDPISVPVTASSPGIFTQSYGPGQAWVVNQDNSFNSTANQAARGSYIAFWATGQGLVDIPQQDGVQPAGPTYPAPTAPVTVTLGPVRVPDANVVFKGLIYSGEIQVNIKIPDDAPVGLTVPLVLTIGGASSRKDATVAIK